MPVVGSSRNSSSGRPEHRQRELQPTTLPARQVLDRRVPALAQADELEHMGGGAGTSRQQAPYRVAAAWSNDRLAVRGDYLNPVPAGTEPGRAREDLSRPNDIEGLDPWVRENDDSQSLHVAMIVTQVSVCNDKSRTIAAIGPKRDPTFNATRRGRAGAVARGEASLTAELIAGRLANSRRRRFRTLGLGRPRRSVCRRDDRP
jgi:hypothetical protein